MTGLQPLLVGGNVGWVESLFHSAPSCDVECALIPSTLTLKYFSTKLLKNFGCHFCEFLSVFGLVG